MSTADAAAVLFEHTGSMSCGVSEGQRWGKKEFNNIAFEQWQVSTCADIEVSP